MSALNECIYKSTHCKEKDILQLGSTENEINKLKTKYEDAIGLKRMVTLIFFTNRSRTIFLLQKKTPIPNKQTHKQKKDVLNNISIA